MSFQSEFEAAPELMSGDDGDIVFIRRDLAATVTAAQAYVLQHDGRSLSGYESDEVEMLKVPAHFAGLDVAWATVHPGTPGAVHYWRFRV